MLSGTVKREVSRKGHSAPVDSVVGGLFRKPIFSMSDFSTIEG